MTFKTQYVVLTMIAIIAVQGGMVRLHQVVTVERSFPMGIAVKVTVAPMIVAVVSNVNTHTANMVAVVGLTKMVRQYVRMQMETVLVLPLTAKSLVNQERGQDVINLVPMAPKVAVIISTAVGFVTPAMSVFRKAPITVMS